MSRSPDRLASATVLVGLLASFLSPASDALAGAWTLEKGTGQVIGTFLYSNSPRGFDDKGKVVNIDDYTKAEFSLLMEYGLTSDLTVILTPSFRHASIGDISSSSRLGYTDLGARYRIFQKDGTVLSLQGLARIPGSRRDDILANVGNTDTEYDVRGLFGHSFKIFEKDAFVDAQAGYRYRTNDPANELRLDGTLGVRPHPDLLLLAQTFNTISVSDPQGVFSKTREHKLQLSAVFDINESVSFQVGGLGTVHGKNALRERGVFSGVWIRF
ncbi:hypothetical protein CH339_11990 [Rhodobium orientis]|uniref:Autotransporter domain-containing protein n=2 Tax=Rhodobium orientis TaxID=34017 RepID=A0A327JNF4_9HYPH|nr:hypothetical protein [Rhodobium orientis]RAI26903.1 hypothetical protein CH339_11990 [Rhodobium orientis]